MENRYSIQFALQHSNTDTSVPPPSDPVPHPVPAPDPYPLVIPGNIDDGSHTATIDATGTMTPVTRALARRDIRQPQGAAADNDDDDNRTGLNHSDNEDAEYPANIGTGEIGNNSGPVNLSLALPWIPSYLNSTAYGERFNSFASLPKKDSKKSTVAAAFNGNNSHIFMNQGLLASRIPSYGLMSSSEDESSGGGNRHFDVSASEFNLPQIFPTRRAAELDALGMWRNITPVPVDSPAAAAAAAIAAVTASSSSVVPTPSDSILRIGPRSRDGTSNSTSNGNAATSSDGIAATNSRTSNGNTAASISTNTDAAAAASSSSSSLAVSSTPALGKPNNIRDSNSSASAGSITPRREIGLPHLPTRWVKNDMEQGVSINSEGNRVEFAIPSSTKPALHSVVALKSDYPIPALCGIYYYEVEVVEHGTDEFISVGFCDIDASLTKVPGHDTRTWGYHGDDGRISACQSPSKSFGPKIGVGDVIGCGISFSKNSVFYTKNGLPLGTAFQDVKGILFPCIGLKNGEVIHTNFGRDEFRFDIEKYVCDEKAKVLSQIRLSKAPYSIINDSNANGSSSNSLVNSNSSGTDKDWGFIKDLVASYFDHVGYLETAKAFERERNAEESAINLENLVRNSVDSTAMDVDMDEDDEGESADEDESDEKKKIRLEVLNRQRIRSCVIDEDIDGALKLLNVFYPTVLQDNYLIKFKLLCRKFVELVRKSIPGSGSNKGKAASSSNSDLSDRSQREWLDIAIQYGQELRKEYKNDTTPIVVNTLSTIFSLLAYEDPGSSRELAHLLDKDELLPLAEELNSAILVSLGKPAVPSLQKLAQHTTQLVWELSDQDYHTASLLNVTDDFLEANRPSQLL